MIKIYKDLISFQPEIPFFLLISLFLFFFLIFCFVEFSQVNRSLNFSGYFVFANWIFLPFCFFPAVDMKREPSATCLGALSRKYSGFKRNHCISKLVGIRNRNEERNRNRIKNQNFSKLVKLAYMNAVSLFFRIVFIAITD